MRPPRGSRLGAIFAATYCVIYAGTVVLGLRELVFDTMHSEFSGVLEIMATLPWSLMLLPACDVLGISKWHDTLAGNPWLYGLTGSLMLLPGALVNAGLCYYIGSKLQRR